MHKKLAADLTSLAHSILQMKNRENVFALKKKAYEVYEKLAVLAYVEEYINHTANPEYSKQELLAKIENNVQKVAQNVEIKEPEVEFESDQEKQKNGFTEEVDIEEPQEVVVKEEVVAGELEEQEEIVTYDLEEIIEDAANTAELEEDFMERTKEMEQEQDKTLEENTKDKPQEQSKEAEVLVLDLEEPKEEKIEKKLPSLEEELQDTIAVDVVADLFENTPKKSLNDKLHGDIQIGLNDRIAFVKNLFNGSQEDFNRVVSQLNTFKTEKEVKKFINKLVKPKYNWAGKEEFEERFLAIVERKFL